LLHPERRSGGRFVWKALDPFSADLLAKAFDAVGGAPSLAAVRSVVEASLQAGPPWARDQRGR
jgi:hypothetical protein